MYNNMTETTKGRIRRKKQGKDEYIKMYNQFNLQIPVTYLNTVIAAHPEWDANRIMNCRYGKRIDVAMLQEIINLTVPKK